jgi:hypothetical protein
MLPGCACSKLHFCVVSLRYTCISAYTCICAYTCILVTRFVSFRPLMLALHSSHSKHRQTMYAEENGAVRQLAELEKTKPEALYWNCTGKGKKPLNKSMASWCRFTCPRFALGRILQILAVVVTVTVVSTIETISAQCAWCYNTSPNYPRTQFLIKRPSAHTRSHFLSRLTGLRSRSHACLALALMFLHGQP